MKERLRSEHRTSCGVAVAFALVFASAAPARAQPAWSVGALFKRGPSENAWRYACNATLIAPAVAVTAAHCLPPSAAGVRLAFSTEPELAQAPLTFLNVRHFVAHEGFTRDAVAEDLNLDDIGLIFLEEAASSPHAELALREELEPGTALSVVSYGPDDPAFQPRARGTTDVRLGSSFESEFIVEAESGIPLCRGDSGGGAFVAADASLVGVISRGLHTGVSCDAEAVTTRIAAHRDWLLRKMDDQERPDTRSSSGCSLSPPGGDRFSAYLGVAFSVMVARRRFARLAGHLLQQRKPADGKCRSTRSWLPRVLELPDVAQKVL